MRLNLCMSVPVSLHVALKKAVGIWLKIFLWSSWNWVNKDFLKLVPTKRQTGNTIPLWTTVKCDQNVLKFFRWEIPSLYRRIWYDCHFVSLSFVSETKVIAFHSRKCNILTIRVTYEMDLKTPAIFVFKNPEQSHYDWFQFCTTIPKVGGSAWDFMWSKSVCYACLMTAPLLLS